MHEATPGRAETLRAGLLDHERAVSAGRQGQALSDPTRLLILKLLLDAERELTVSDVCLITEREQGGISRHLRILLDAALVEKRPAYRWVLYKPTQTGERLLTALIGTPDD